MKPKREPHTFFKHPELKLLMVAVFFLGITWPVFNLGSMPLLITFMMISSVWCIAVLLLFLMRHE